jgi:hypothetical protein
LTTCRHCPFQVDNLDQIIVDFEKLVKRSLLNYKTNANFKGYIKAKVILTDKNYKLIEESKYFKELKVDNN